MSLTEIILVNVLSAVTILGMLAVCLRSRPADVALTGRRVYRVHRAWYLFSAVGGVLLVGIFAIASSLSDPADKSTAAWCSAASAVFFVFFTFFLRSLSVTVDEDRVTSRTLIGEQSVALRDIERVAVVGLVVEVRMREDPVTKKRRGPLTFLAGFRGLRDLMATIRARAGLAEPSG